MKDKIHIQKFNEHQENIYISDVISSEKINTLKDLGWSNKEIYDLVNFLMLDDSELKNVKLTSLKGVPSNIKGSLEDVKLTSLKGLPSNIKGSSEDLPNLTSLDGVENLHNRIR